MMIIDEAVRYLGQNVNQQAEVISFLSGFSIDVKRALEVEDGFDGDGIYKDDGDLYLENLSEGFCFLLKTENSLFESKKNLPLSEGDYYFTTIFLYADEKDGYSEYKGDLPYGFRFSDTNDVISKKIGVSADFVNEHIERWDNLNGIRLSLSAMVDNKPKIVIVGKTPSNFIAS